MLDTTGVGRPILPPGTWVITPLATALSLCSLSLHLQSLRPGMLKRALRAARKRCAVLLEATHRPTKHTGSGVAPALCPPKPRDARPTPRTNPQPDPATIEPSYRATSLALRVAEIVDLIALFLAPPDQLAFSRTHSFAFHAIAPRIWRRLPSLRPLVNLLPSNLDGLEDVSLRLTPMCLVAKADFAHASFLFHRTCRNAGHSTLARLMSSTLTRRTHATNSRSHGPSCTT